MRGSAALLAIAGLALAGRAVAQPLLEAPARLGAAHPADEAVRPAAFAVPEENIRIVPDHIVEGRTKPVAPSYQVHPVDDFLRSKPILAERSETRRDAGKFGDGLAD